MSRIIQCSLMIFLIMGISNIAFAKNTIVVRSANAKVFEKPSTQSNVLLTLKMGNPIHVLGITKSGWAKVQVNVNGSFRFTGWMFKSSLGVKQTSAPATAPQASPDTSSRERVSDLERFFQPTEKPDALVPIQQSKRSKSKSKPTSSTKNTSPRVSTNNIQSSVEPVDWMTERFSFSIVPTLLLHKYILSNATDQKFKYDIMGPALAAHATISAPALFQDKFFVSAQGGAYYGNMTTETNLRDGGGNRFGSIKSKNSVFGLRLRGHFLYKVKEAPQGHILVGPTFGYELLSFKADDIVDNNGDRSGLYVSQKSSNLLLGIRTETSLFPPFLIIAGADFGLKNNYEEDPSDFSGLDAKAGKVISPYVSLMFPISRPNHFLGVDYRLRYQKIELTGDSQPRASVVVTDAIIEQLYQFAGLHYQYQF